MTLTCFAHQTTAGPPATTCGNGIVEQGEACDDGNTITGDGCSATCHAEITLFVAAATCPSPGDGSEQDPFCTIQAGLDASEDGDTVVVADGLYTGDGNRDLDFAGKAITLRSAGGPVNCVIHADGSQDEPHQGFRFHSGESHATVLDGFTITGGHARAPDVNWGGGINCESSSPTITNCVIADNTARFGGGISFLHSSASLAGCTITRNEAFDKGGGMFGDHCDVTIRDCTIERNRAAANGMGGGIGRNFGANYVITGSRICDNAAGYRSGGVAADTLVMSDCVVSGNWAAGAFGGGIDCWEGTITNTIISGNTAGRGGGVNCEEATFTNCVITGNTAYGEFVQDGLGGGVFTYYNASFDNCTITHNRARSGGAISGSGTVVNCILWDNVGEDDGNLFPSNYGPWPTVSFSCIQDEWAGEGNISANPRLSRDGIHLLAGSPCIDAGFPYDNQIDQLDTDGEPRVAGTRVDIGADEFIDTDLDTLPDWWERRHYGTYTLATPDADDDGDGLTNIQELTAARNPHRGPATIYVAEDGNDQWDGLAPYGDGTHGPKSTIQAGINEAHAFEGDRVIVAGGTYTGLGNRDIDYHGKNISVGCQPGTGSCIVDCQSKGRGFAFHTQEGPDARLEGFTITSGYVASHQWQPASRGCGILCLTSHPVIKDCIVTRCGDWHRGGAVACVASDALLLNGSITHNMGMYHGTAITTKLGRPIFANCLIAGNLSLEQSCISLDSTYATFLNCTIVDNTDATGAGAITAYDARPSIHNSIVWGNTPGYDGRQIYVYGDEPLTVTYSCIQNGWEGEGNIDADPRFVSPGQWHDNGTPDDCSDDTWLSGNFRLLPGSPCIDAGRSNGVANTDLDNHPRLVDDPATPDTGISATSTAIVDMGAYEYRPGDANNNGRCDLVDFAPFNTCTTGPDNLVAPNCITLDLNADGHVDLVDYVIFQNVMNTP